MKIWWLSLVDALRSSFWFVPTVMAVGGLALAAGMLGLDAVTDVSDRPGLGWLDAGDAEAIRSLLASFLSAIITVMTVVFSVTVVALQLASSQFGPRLLRTFMQNRGTHLSMGAFIGVCVYYVTVLGFIGRFEQKTHVPHLSALGALLLAIVSLGVLVFFIHHMARSIQAPEVIASVAREIDLAIARWYPQDDCVPVEDRPEPLRPVEEARQVTATWSGYVQAVDIDTLVRLASERDLLLRLRSRAGDFLVCDEVMADVWPAERVDENVDRAVRQAFLLGTHRTPTQDIEFAIDQLVEIAVRALSPSINDPFTAITCVDRLSNGLNRLARCRMNLPEHRDEAGMLRVCGVASTYPGVVNAAFDKIRQAARRDASVTIHLLEAIRVIAHHTINETQRAALRRQAEMIHRGSQEALPEPEDRRDAHRRYEQALAALDAAAQQGGGEEASAKDQAELRA